MARRRLEVRQAFTSGYWATDSTLAYDGVPPRFSQDNRWALPKRWRLAGAFAISLGGNTQNLTLPPVRRSRHGNLAVFVNDDHPIETIQVPTADDALRHAFAGIGLWTGPDAQHGDIEPGSRFGWTHPSNEQRYLTGVLGMTGGLQRAAQFLLHPFLRKTFSLLGADPNPPVDKVAPTVNVLGKWCRNKETFNIRDEGERERLGGLVVKASMGLKTPLAFVRYDQLREDWKAYREAYWLAHPIQGSPDPSVGWEAAGIELQLLVPTSTNDDPHLSFDDEAAS